MYKKTFASMLIVFLFLVCYQLIFQHILYHLMNQEPIFSHIILILLFLLRLEVIYN